MLQLPLSAIKKMEALTQESDCISLSQAAMRVGGIPQNIKENIKNILNSDQTDYYSSAFGIPRLREKIADHLNKKHQTSLTPNNIIITHGSIGALSTLFLSLLEPGDEVLIPEPAYPAYALLAQIARAQPVFIPSILQEDSSSPSWNIIDIENVKKRTTPKTKIIVLSNPCNPTGAVLDERTLKELIVWCEHNAVMLIVDEVYDDYLFTPNFQSATPFVEKSNSVIRVGSFSKNFAMSGWRIGYMVVPSLSILHFGHVQDALINCPNLVGQYAALYALDHPELVTDFKKTITANCRVAEQKLYPLVRQGIISFAPAQGGFNLFIRTSHKDATSLCYELLTQKKVSTVPGSTFGPSNANSFRLCYARKTEVLEEGIQRIISFFEERS